MWIDTANAGDSRLTYAPLTMARTPLFARCARYRSSVYTSAMSAPARFETGPITPADWHNASWLAAKDTTPTQFRFEFELATAPEWARVYVASPGCTAVLLNGQTPKVDLRGICKRTPPPSLYCNYGTLLPPRPRHRLHPFIRPPLRLSFLRTHARPRSGCTQARGWSTPSASLATCGTKPTTSPLQ